MPVILKTVKRDTRPKNSLKAVTIYCIRRIFFASLEKKKRNRETHKKINKTNEEIKTNIETKK